MTHVAFFGHNAADAAVRRRARSFARAGLGVTGFMMRRGDPEPTEWDNVDLGPTRDNAYAARVGAILRGARIAARSGRLPAASLIYARNLDMLATAQLACRLARIRRPTVYECLDVHHLLTGEGAVARSLRLFEARLLAATDLLTISSPAFEREYFSVRHPGRYRPFLIENRLVGDGGTPPRPGAVPANDPGRPLRIGWFGNLRCARSLRLLEGLAARFPGQVEVVLRGYPARSVFPDLEARLAGRPGIAHHGRFRSPEDLPGIYGEVDLVWAGDWYEKGANSLWLLPNRLYEGGYFGVPAVAPTGTETARWIVTRGAGFVVPDPVEAGLGDLVSALLANRELLTDMRMRLVAQPDETFLEPPDHILDMVSAALSTGRIRDGPSPRA